MWENGSPKVPVTVVPEFGARICNMRVSGIISFWCLTELFSRILHFRSTWMVKIFLII